jgi:hypothetical protein
MQLAKLIAIAVCLASVVQSQSFDFCDLGAKLLSSDVVIVRVRLGFTMHGAYLLSDRCAHKAPAAALLSPHDPGAPDVPFEIDRESLERLKPFMRLNGGASVACAIVSGVFTTAKSFTTYRADGQLHGNGFGPQGALQFAFVLRSVQTITGCQ